MDTRRLASVGTATAALAVAPGVASAHPVGASRFEAPIPLPLLLAGAGATVALTALWLGLTDRTGRPTGESPAVTVPAAVSRPVRHAARWLFALAVVAALVAGVTGRQVPVENLATVFVWPVWFRGLALVAVLIGTPWPLLSPWWTAHRGFVALEGDDIALAGAYPDRLGQWPAVVGFVGLLGIVAALTVVPRSPRLTTVAVAGYGLAMVGGAVLYGTDWLDNADPLAVFYRLLGRVAPVSVDRRDGETRLVFRPPWTGCLAPVAGPSTVVFVVAAVYTVSFDGFTSTRTFQSVAFAVRETVATGPLTGVVLYLLGLALFVAAFGAAGWLVEYAATGDGREWLAATVAFAPTVVPVAAGYEVAHNYPYVVRNLGRLVGIALQPVVPGVGPLDLLGWLSLPLFWASQVALVVGGHVVAVVAADAVAVRRYDSPVRARRGHLPLVVLMVGYTVLSLWIVSRPVVT